MGLMMTCKLDSTICVNNSIQPACAHGFVVALYYMVSSLLCHCRMVMLTVLCTMLLQSSFCDHSHDFNLQDICCFASFNAGCLDAGIVHHCLMTLRKLFICQI